MGSELLSVKWNDHRNTFFDILATARENKAFCDATIACEGNLYPVHCFVISTCSTYFESILKDVSDTHPLIVLADIKSKDIEDLLQYMYTGEVKVLQEDIDSLIKAGEVLKIKGIGGIGVADENEGEVEVADETEKPKKKKRISNDSLENPEKRQRIDEFGNRTQLSASSRESKKKKKAKSLLEKTNEDSTNQKEMDGSIDPLNQPESEFTAVKEELFQPSEDFPEHYIKEEMCESLMNEEPELSEDTNQFEAKSEQEYYSYTSEDYKDISMSSMSPAQKIHMDWIMQNEHKGQASENRRLPLTGWCLVCSDRGSGYHYGIETCEGCKAFFKRSTRNNIGMDYNCVLGGICDISRASRGTCKACRFKKCLTSGMRVDNVRPDRTRGGSQRRSDDYVILKQD